MKAIVFLGGGRITNALVAGLRLAKYDKPILVHDRNPGKLRKLKKQYGVAVEPNLQRAVEQARLLIIAVRPDSVSDLLLEIGELQKGKPRRPLMLVSLAAGIPFSKLRARMPSPARWARAMPSPVCRSGRGLTALTFDSAFSRTARRDVKDFFALPATHPLARTPLCELIFRATLRAARRNGHSSLPRSTAGTASRSGETEREGR